LPEPMYMQNCLCLGKVGFPFTRPEFHVDIRQAHLDAAKIAAAEAGSYFHLSPFTTEDGKELPPAQLVELIESMQIRWPERRLVLSGSPTERERRKMESLVGRLRRKPWRVFPGDLTLMQLAAVIQHSAAHLCGDTGTLHVALMTGRPTVSWFRPNPGMQAWIPDGERHRTLVGVVDGGGNLGGIAVRGVIANLEEVLNAGGGR
jgi:ADP-heptose:LPS heptosyltransferase